MRFAMGSVATFRGRGVRSCGYKQKHWTTQAANAHLASLRRRFGASAADLNVYRCRYCCAWHVGRQRTVVAHEYQQSQTN